MYSNGFDFEAVLPVLKGRLGWSSDTIRYDSFHALCTEANLRAVQPTSLTDDEFETYKDTLEDQIIQRCLRSVFSKAENKEQVLLHRRVGTIKRVVENTGVFCGLRLRVVPDVRYVQQIKTVTLLFDEAVTLKVYLFQHGLDTPLYSQNVTVVANVPKTIALEDWIISYSTTQEGTFYLGYFQDDTARAVRYDVRYNPTHYVCAGGFQSEASGETFDFENSTYQLDAYGLNAEVVTFMDYTHLITGAPWVFDEAIGITMVYYLLELIVSTTVSNATERALKGAYDAIELKHYLYGAIPAPGVAKITGLNEIMGLKYAEIRESFLPKPQAQTFSLC